MKISVETANDLGFDCDPLYKNENLCVDIDEKTIMTYARTKPIVIKNKQRGDPFLSLAENLADIFVKTRWHD